MRFIAMKRALLFFTLILPGMLSASEPGADSKDGGSQDAGNGRSAIIMSHSEKMSGGFYQYDKSIFEMTTLENDLEHLMPALEQQYSKVEFIDCIHFDEIKHGHQINQYDDILFPIKTDDTRFRPGVAECLEKLHGTVDQLQDRLFFVLGASDRVSTLDIKSKTIKTPELLEKRTKQWLEHIIKTLEDIGIRDWNPEYYAHSARTAKLFNQPWLRLFKKRLRQKIRNDCNKIQQTPFDVTPKWCDAIVVAESEQPASPNEATPETMGEPGHDAHSGRSVAILAHIGITFPKRPNPDDETSFKTLYYDDGLTRLIPALKNDYQKITFFDCTQLDQINEYDDVVFFIRGNDPLGWSYSQCLQNLNGQVYNLQDKLFIAVGSVHNISGVIQNKLVHAPEIVEKKSKKLIHDVVETLENLGVTGWNPDYYGLTGFGETFFSSDKEPWVTTFMRSLNHKYCQQNPQQEGCPKGLIHSIINAFFG